MSSNAYVAQDAAQDTIERMSRRLTGDVRSKIRRVAPPMQPMTDEWLEQLCYVQHLASVAATEEREAYGNAELAIAEALDTAGNSEGGAGIGKSGHETVWEKDDVCVRLIIEEGKTNLLVRTLIEYWAAFHQVPDQAVVPSIQRFEMVLGVLVRCALSCYEALQTLDIRAMIDHCGQCLRLSVQEPALTATGPCCMKLLSQFGLVITYLAHIVANMERLRSEEAIFGKVVDLDILNLVLNHVDWAAQLVFSPVFGDIAQSMSSLDGDQTMQRLCPYLVQRDFPSSYVIFFAALVRSELFKTNIGTLLPTKESKKRLATTADRLLKLLSPTLLADPSIRKALRPLTDFVMRFK
jgi:hypothetical protein